jgi:sulfane dehydrogenase subunit SoxC
MPLAKAMDDCLVAYGQNGEPVRVEQGYPIRMIVPGWEGPFNVKYLSHIKVVDERDLPPISAANRAGTISSGGRNP